MTLLSETGYQEEAARVHADVVIVEAAEFGVVLKCLSCRKDAVARTIVGDPDAGEPSAILCGECNARIDEEIFGDRDGMDAGGNGRADSDGVTPM